MVLTVIITVIVLAFVVSGYWLNSDFEVERQGLLQITSVPSGADVDIDGDSSWLQRTNTSKTLSSGEHTIALSKEGYDTWTKTINIREGLLYRIHYPRLFLQERTNEKVASVADIQFATVSPDRNTMLASNSIISWSVIDLDEEKAPSHTLSLAALLELADAPATELPSSQIIEANWARDNAHVLIEAKLGGQHKWLLLNTEDVSRSIDLTKEFDTDFDDVEIINNSANTLLVLQNHNLRKIDISSKQISAILAENVVSLDHYENEVVFVAQNEDGEYYLGLTKLGDNKNTTLATFDTPAQAMISKFYDDKYITVVTGSQVYLYQKDDFTLVSEFSLNFSPSKVKVGRDGTFIIMYQGNQIATLDMEALAITEWQTDGPSFGWLDNYMIYSVSEGELVVYDFDGLNRRVLASQVSADFPVTITDDKWLYYASNNQLIREWLVAR